MKNSLQYRGSAYWYTDVGYHLPDHHHIRAQVFVDTKDVQDTDVPEDDVYAVDDSAVAHVRLVVQPQHEPQQEGGDGSQVCDVPVVLHPHTDLLLQLPRLRHQNLHTRVQRSPGEERLSGVTMHIKEVELLPVGLFHCQVWGCRRWQSTLVSTAIAPSSPELCSCTALNIPDRKSIAVERTTLEFIIYLYTVYIPKYHYRHKHGQEENSQCWTRI